MPFILDGARQVGKTYSLKEFGRENFDDVVYVNFESNPTIASFFDADLSPRRIIKYLESAYNKTITPDGTLIIFDEIQVCERALTALKYFCEEANEYHLAAAGSLLGVAINREKFSYPVGKVDSATLHSLDFEEFLWATNNEKITESIHENFLSNAPLPDALHTSAMELYKHYLIIGGMPAVVQNYLKTGKLIDISDLQHKILNEYIADMAKYASNTESVRIRAAYNSIPNQLAKDNKKFQYKVVQRGGNAALFGSSIDWLCFAGVVLRCQKIEQAVQPIAVYSDMSSFKLYMGDVGLLTMKSGIAQQTILSSLNTDNSFLGALSENYVAQALAANGHNLFYWESKSIAEIDFVLQKREEIIPVEVKSGTNTRSRSLSVFVQKYKPAYSIRVSAKNFGFENNIKSVPLYAVYRI